LKGTKEEEAEKPNSRVSSLGKELRLKKVRTGQNKQSEARRPVVPDPREEGTRQGQIETLQRTD
jgi:hypothetical protein